MADNKPTDNRNKQLATLGDLADIVDSQKQISQAVGSVSTTVNEMVGWIRSIDQSTFIVAHKVVNGTVEFSDESVAKVREMFEEGRTNITAYDQIVQEKNVAAERMGAEFEYDGKKYTVTKTETPDANVPEAMVTTETFQEDGKDITGFAFLNAAKAAFDLLPEDQKNPAPVDDTPEEDKALAAEQPTQAPAEPETPADIAVQDNASEEESKDATEKG